MPGGCFERIEAVIGEDHGMSHGPTQGLLFLCGEL